MWDETSSTSNAEQMLITGEWDAGCYDVLVHFVFVTDRSQPLPSAYVTPLA